MDSNETSSEPQETQLTSFDVNNTDGILKKKPSSHCGSVVSVETVSFFVEVSWCRIDSYEVTSEPQEIQLTSLT